MCEEALEQGVASGGGTRRHSQRDRTLELFGPKRARGSQPAKLRYCAGLSFHRLVAGSPQELLAGATMNQMTSMVSIQSESK